MARRKRIARARAPPEEPVATTAAAVAPENKTLVQRQSPRPAPQRNAPRAGGQRTLHVAIVVYGDIGRSPRMQLHAASLASHGHSVSLVGYPGSAPPKDLVESPSIRIHHIQPAAKIGRNLPRWLYLVCAVWRVLSQALQLLWALCWRVPRAGAGPVDVILVQNPPAFPTLGIVQLYRRVLAPRSRLVIDWHNFGYTLMSLNLGAGSRIVRFARWYEFAFGRHADTHVCVTEAMAAFLRADMRVSGPVVVLHDRAPAHFGPLGIDERHALFAQLPETRLSSTTTLFSVRRFPNRPAKLLETRPVLLVSSTSWTEDEDFGLLWDALQLYDRHCDAFLTDRQCQRRLPPLFVIITGKGPLQQYYMRRWDDMALRHVTMRSLWLPAELYPRLLGAADLGVSLHQSSSGLDLPMKVVDMFGAGLPVAALEYPTLRRELVVDGRNGFLFKTAAALSARLEELFQNWPAEGHQLGLLRDGVRSMQQSRWEDHWDQYILPSLQRLF